MVVELKLFRFPAGHGWIHPMEIQVFQNKAIDGVQYGVEVIDIPGVSRLSNSFRMLKILSA